MNTRMVEEMQVYSLKFDKFERLILQADAIVHSLLDPDTVDTGCWDAKLIKHIFMEFEVERICSLPLSPR